MLYKIAKILFKNKKPNEIPHFLIKSAKKFTELYYGEKRTEQDAVQLIADQFFTPIAKFHSKKQVIKWGNDNNLKFLNTSTTYFGQHRICSFQKKE